MGILLFRQAGGVLGRGGLGGGGGVCMGVGTHQDTKQSHDKLYKTPTDYTKTLKE